MNMEIQITENEYKNVIDSEELKTEPASIFIERKQQHVTPRFGKVIDDIKEIITNKPFVHQGTERPDFIKHPPLPASYNFSNPEFVFD